MTTTTNQTPTTATVEIAKALSAALGQESSADAYRLAGSDYVVTRNTGEGCDFAYDPDDLDEASIADCAADYSMWCNGVQPVEDLGVAVAYYLETERVLAVGGSCTPMLSEDQVAVLDCVRDGLMAGAL